MSISQGSTILASDVSGTTTGNLIKASDVGGVVQSFTFHQNTASGTTVVTCTKPGSITITTETGGYWYNNTGYGYPLVLVWGSKTKSSNIATGQIIRASDMPVQTTLHYQTSGTAVYPGYSGNIAVTTSVALVFGPGVQMTLNGTKVIYDQYQHSITFTWN